MTLKRFFTSTLLVVLTVFFAFSNASPVIVNSAEKLQTAIDAAKAGDEIVLANGIYQNVELKFTGEGTAEKPIVLRAETAGKVFIEGESCVKFGGNYLVVDGLYFRNGYTPSDAVIEFRLNKEVANHCRVTNCVIEDFNQMSRDRADHWVEFWGRNNQLDHCYIAGKSNSGPTIMVVLKGNENIKNFHQITNNHFGPRPRKGGPHGETIQIGDSFTSMSPSNTSVANNLFEKCDGEVEIISNKSNFNEFKNNVFYHSEGSLVLRHGNYCMVDGNYFIGDDNSNNMGGVRVVNTGHWIVNNYFYDLKGEIFRSPLSVMNGVPKSPLNRYNQVTDMVVAYNTWVNCKSPWQFSVGSNVDQAAVLPLSEIRSAKPIRSIVANNIIYNEKGDSMPIMAYELIDGVSFENNIINNQNVAFQMYKGLNLSTAKMSKVNDYLYFPATNLNENKIYKGFDFETIKTDLLGNSREKHKAIGAVALAPSVDPQILDKKKYGTNWFSNEKPAYKAKTYTASTKVGDLAAKIKNANDGDIILLGSGTYKVSESLVINKKITIQAKKKKAIIVYSGASASAAFEMHPKGQLILKNVALSGKGTQYAFASLQKGMSSLYDISVEGCEVSNFDYVLKAYKETFADNISFDNSSLKNCNNGIDLSEEINDEGDYNVEFLTFSNCKFDNIKANVINYYRGGYDESTIGGNLLVDKCVFTNSGGSDKNGLLINNRGIINVALTNNTFTNNPVKAIAVLWGAKNNTHSNNKISNSAEIKVEENIKLKMMY